MAHHQEQGFSAIETVLLLVIVAIIGFVGWFVYHTDQKSNSVLNAATTTSNNAGPHFSSKSKQATASTGGTDNQSLQTDLNAATSATNQDSKDLTNTNNSLNDQSTLTSVPQ